MPGGLRNEKNSNSLAIERFFVQIEAKVYCKHKFINNGNKKPNFLLVNCFFQPLKIGHFRAESTGKKWLKVAKLFGFFFSFLRLPGKTNS